MNKTLTPLQSLKVTAVIIIICFLTLFSYRIIIKDYIKVEATVLGYNYEYSYKSKNHRNYIYYEYIVNENTVIGKTYSMFFSNKKIGDKEIIYINPDKPEEIASKLFQQILIITIFLLFLLEFQNIKLLKNNKLIS